MQDSQQNQEFEDLQSNKKEKEKRKTSFFQVILDGSFLGKDGFLNQLPYILFLVFLGILYIANTFHSERILRDRKRLELEIKELQPEAISISSQLMLMSNQTEVAKLCKEHSLGLKENLEPPYKIVLHDSDIKLINRKTIKD